MIAASTLSLLLRSIAASLPTAPADHVLRLPSTELQSRLSDRSAWRGGESARGEQTWPVGGTGHLTKRQAEPKECRLLQRVLRSGCRGARRVLPNVSGNLGRHDAPDRTFSH